MGSMNAPLNRKLRMGLVGGGGNAFIGRVHAMAATLDHRAELVAGALSSNPERARPAAAELGIASGRAYGSFADLIRGESQLGVEQRIDFITIATPNFTHFEMARAALESGFHVVCEKPLTTSLPQAETLARLVEQSGCVFALAHNYSGYPLVRQAREMIREGALGEVQAIRATYLQGGLRGREPGKPPARGAWKTDPAKAGNSGALADIGTHAFHLIRFVTGLEPCEVACQLKSFWPQGQLDDYGHAMLRFAQGALGTITVSQVTHGRLNDLSLEVDGSMGSIAWRQEEPDVLVVRRFGKPREIYEKNPRVPFLHALSRRMCRLPGGHPEGVLEAFANVYQDCFDGMVAHASGRAVGATSFVYPSVYDGVAGVQFVEQCLASSRENAAWKPLRVFPARSGCGELIS